jgi:hypothetical protein
MDRRFALRFLIGASGPVLLGCKLTKPDGLENPTTTTVGGSAAFVGGVNSALRVVVVSRPLDDPALGDAVWRVADEQVIESDRRASLEQNGLRIGRISGELPPEIQAILDAPPPRKVEPLMIAVPKGENALVDLGANEPQLNLLLNRDGKVAGKDYADAKGHLRLTLESEEPGSVTIRLVPLLRFGPVRQGWTAVSGGSPLAPQQLVMRNGQDEETFREMSASVSLSPGQALVVSGWMERDSSLGRFLFTSRETGSDREERKVLFLWAGPSTLGSQKTQPALTQKQTP